MSPPYRERNHGFSSRADCEGGVTKAMPQVAFKRGNGLQILGSSGINMSYASVAG